MSYVSPDFPTQLQRLRTLCAQQAEEIESLRRQKQALEAAAERHAAEGKPRAEIAADLLTRIGEIRPDPLPDVAVIVAHPDDESVGAGSLLPRLRKARFVYATDGAPRDPRDAAAAGFKSRREYAAARRRERAAALALAGIDGSRVEELGVVDQEAALNLTQLTREIADRLRQWRPRAVITHPYEGGHPDHDAVAFAVHAACRLQVQRGSLPPAILETTWYHARAGQLTVSDFLPIGDSSVVTVELNEARRVFKKQLFACYGTQQETLSWFPLQRERFRSAPSYDFTRPPHEGQLLYERFCADVTGDRFSRLAAQSIRQFGLDRL